MKPAFPAQFRVQKNGKTAPLCLKHMQRESQDEGTKVEKLPDDSEVGCSECSADRING